MWCLFCILGGLFIINLPAPNPQNKCKTESSPSKLRFQRKKLKSFEYYKNNIIGKLLPRENTVKSTAKQDINELKLMGVAVVGEQKSAVILLTKEKRCITVREKGEIGSYTVKKIDTSHIVLAKNGKEYKLQIVKENGVSCSTARYTPPASAQQVKIVTASPSPPQTNSQKGKKPISTVSRKPHKTKKQQAKKRTPKKKRVPFFFKRKPKKPGSPSSNPLLEILKRIR